MLHGDGVALPSLAERFGTPLYVYSRSSLAAALGAWNSAYDWAPHRVCYAVKANASGAILRLFASLGAGADIVSGGEMLAALRAGFAPESIVFAGVGKTDAELTLGLEKGIGDFNVESEDEARRLSHSRLIPRTDGADLPARQPQHRRAVPSLHLHGPEAEQVRCRHRRRGGAPPASGGSAVGGGAGPPLPHRLTDHPDRTHRRGDSGARRTSPVACSPRVCRCDSSISGGARASTTRVPVSRRLPISVSRLRPILEGLPLEIVLEPGRSLVAAAGVLLTRVVLVKEHGGKRFVVVDAGMNDLIRPALYEAYHRIEPVVERAAAMATVDVVGPICETGDFLALDRELPEVEVGDLLAVRDAGAYGFSMASNYNMRPRPAEVMVANGEALLVRRRESFDDLVRNEV